MTINRGAATMSATTLDRDETIGRIRAALKRRSGKDWSVTGGRGTGWGWLAIDAPPRRRTWQHVQTRTPEPPTPGAIYAGASGITPPYRVEYGAEDRIAGPADDPWAREAAGRGQEVFYNWEVEDASKPYGHMSPMERVELTKLLGLTQQVHFQGHKIAASHGHWQEHVDRAEGREPTVYGERYWD